MQINGLSSARQLTLLSISNMPLLPSIDAIHGLQVVTDSLSIVSNSLVKDFRALCNLNASSASVLDIEAVATPMCCDAAQAVYNSITATNPSATKVFSCS